MIDSYELLLTQYISKEDFFRFGLEKTIYIPTDKVEAEWQSLKNNIANNKAVFIRGFKTSTGMHLASDFYSKVFGNKQVKKDPSNTQNPAKIIEKLTGYKKANDLKNYQLTSIFGRSRNILAFCAPWNIVYIPSVLDPLLSVDAHTDLANEYKKRFMQHSYEKFKPYIDEFNEMVSNHQFKKSMDEYFQTLFDDGHFDKKEMMAFENTIREDFAPIKF
ncbi:MAG: hypothetical protein PF439_02145 [Helicobacteraceae bacterium]|jgi:hypothetical protein|nr:hypothetical protein [Helicobacteraceae bacterium]